MDRLILKRCDLKSEAKYLQSESISLENIKESRKIDIASAEEIIYRDGDVDRILKKKDKTETDLTVSRIPRVPKCRYYKIHEIMRMLGGEEIDEFRRNCKHDLWNFEYLEPFEKAKYAIELEKIVRRVNGER